ncbi:MAG: BolA family transcriptional regulator [Snodgrassella sp.]|nr:BolA family transcriptional regulator [Snodgrassella sp.]
MNDIQTAICIRLQSLQPKQVKLIDHTHLHARHLHNNGGGHYHLTIVSDAFIHLSRVARQRKIYQLLNDLFQQQIIHALSIKALTHSEYLAL